jgi:hypothetical protein
MTLAASTAFAGARVFSNGSTVMRLQGSTGGLNGAGTDPFTLQVFANANECLRITVPAQGSDLEATLTTPNGTQFRDDDSFGALRPILKVRASNTGWNTLQISRYNGDQTFANFTLDIQRLPITSTLCAGLTPPRSLEVNGAKPAAGFSTFPGGPGAR